MDIQNQTKIEYPVHHEDIEIHPRGANIKKCELCEERKHITQKEGNTEQTFWIEIVENSSHLVCVKIPGDPRAAITSIKITNCPCCGRKL